MAFSGHNPIVCQGRSVLGCFLQLDNILFVRAYHALSIHSPVDRQLDSFSSGAIVNNADVNVPAQILHMLS